MRRSLTLAWFLTKDFLRSWHSFAPLALALTFYALAFQYGATPAYFAAVTPAAVTVITVLTLLLLAGRLNRAATYPFAARLRYRSEFLVALVLTTLAIAFVVTGLIVGMALWQGRLLTPLRVQEWLLLVALWPVLYLFGALFGLLLTNLTSRAGSHIFFYALIAAFAAVYDYQFELAQANRTILLDIWSRLLQPFASALTPFSSANLLQAVLLVLGYSLACFIVADWLFARKDLTWTE